MGGIGGGCTSCGSGNGPGSWGSWGGGNVGFSIAMGSAPGGAAAGLIRVGESANRPALLSRASLGVAGYLGVLDVRSDAGGMRQVIAPASVADVQTNALGGYDVRVFSRAAVTSTNGTLATFAPSAVPVAVWRVEPDVPGVLDGSRVRVTATLTNGSTKTSIFIADTNAPSGTIRWTVRAPGNLFDHVTESWTEPGPANQPPFRLERMAWRWPGGMTNVFVQTRKLAPFSWGWGVIESSVGEGVGQKTTYTQYWEGTTGRLPGGEIASIEEWDGNWTQYEYDSSGRLTATIRPNGTAPLGSGSMSRTEYSYSVVSGAGDSGLAVHSRIPRTVTERVDANVVGRAWSILTAGQKRTIRAADTGATWSNATNRSSWTWHYPTGHAFAGRFWKKLSEDRVLTVYSYSTNASGESVVTVLTGSPAGTDPLTATTIVNGTEITTVVGSYGETISQTSRWIDGGTAGATFASVTFSDFDDARRWRRMDLVDGTYETRTFDCCGLGLITDRDGVTTQLLYDAAGRQIGSTRLGITVTNLLDPAGAALRSVRVGTDGSTNLLSSAGYDTAGSLRASTNALGGVTTYSWSINASGELVESSADPAGATQIIRHYRDGGVRSVTGTGVPNRSVTRTFGSQYMDIASTVMIDGSAVTETVLDAAGDPGDSVTTIRDALGQVRRVDQANSIKHAYAYNRLGQMVQEVDADGVTRLYRYNAEADIEYVAVDVNPANTTWDADGNPSIDFNQDRLVRQATDSTTYAGQTVRRQRRWEYPTAGSTNAVEVRSAMVTPAAQRAWTIERGQASAHAMTVNRLTQTRNATNTAPDGSWTVAVYTSGRLTSRTAYASNGTQLSRETYGYDVHGRVNQITDVRNGTRTQTYNAADLLVSDTTPASGTGQGPRTTTRQYSTAGRLTRVTLPDGANLDLAYSPDGLLTNRSGGRQPTVDYAYDAAGRLTTLRTWKNATAQTGAKTTQWSYQLGTGFMVQKQIGNEPPIQYTFTAAGRPRTETVMAGDFPATEWKYGFDADPVVRKVGDVTEVQYLRATDFDGNPATPDLSFTYDRAGRRIGAAQVTAGTTNTAVTWSRNAYGMITSESWTAGPLAGHILAHTYDDKLRRTNLTFQVGVITNGVVGYGFDSSGRISWIGDGTSSATYTYVPNSPLIQQVQLRNGSTVTLAVTRQYDRWNRLQSMTAAGTTSGSVGQEYTYNDAGQRIRAQLLDGSYWVYEYDTLGQVKSAKRYLADGQVLAGQQFEYSYDDIGNRTSGKTGGDTAGANLRTTTDTTDAEGRLSQRTNPRQYEVQGAAQVGTDVRVNGTVATRQGEYFRFEGTAVVAAAQWLDQSVTLNGAALISGRKKYVPPQTETILHDVAGNRIQDGRWEMRWDNENRLVDVRTSADPITAGIPNQRLRYTYDADGRLIERRRFSWVSGAWSLAETTRYLNDGLQCVAEFNASNALLRRQVWGLDLDGSRGGQGGIGGLLWIVSQANGTHYAAPDGSGNVVALFGTSGTETARYEYGPFGELLRMSGTAIAAENPWRFSSKRQDPTTDWVHYEFRVYDPSSGRWLSRDPIGEAGGENLYGFVGNDPVNRVDLFGFECSGPTCGVANLLMDSKTRVFLGVMGGLQQEMDSTDSSDVGYVLSLEIDLFQTMIPMVMPIIAQDLQMMHMEEVYCQGGVLAVAADSVEQFADMFFGAEHISRAIDLDNKYTAGEQAWEGVQAAATIFLFFNPAKRVAPKVPAVAGPPPLPIRAAPLPSPKTQPSSVPSSCCQTPANTPKVCGPEAPRPPPSAELQCAPAAKSGETAATKAGRQAHKDWHPGEGFEKEVTLPSGKRADAVNFQTKCVKELKPGNSRAVKRGQKQVERYRQELEKEYGGTWTGVVETYKR